MIESNTPLGLSSPFSDYPPNADIFIENIMIKIHLSEGIVSELASVYFRMQPTPSLKLKSEIVIDSSADCDRFSRNEIEIVQEGIRTKWLVTSITPLEALSLGYETKSTANLSHIVFNVVNFPSFIGDSIRLNSPNWEFSATSGRLILKDELWEVTVDSTNKTMGNISSLYKVRGFAITHVGKLQRIDRSPFSSDDTKVFFQTFSNFLAFLRGAWCGPILFSGFRENDLVWSDHLSSHLITSWTSEAFRFPSPKARNMLPRLFRNFMLLQNNFVWGASIRTIIYWYVIANSDQTLETSLLVIQAALELICWNYLVLDKRVLTKKAYDKNPYRSASEKIAKLLLELGISTEVPIKFANIYSYAMDHSEIPLDGPTVFTRIRNSLVHPNSNRIFTADEMMEARHLGLWYIETSLLKILNYKGEYRSRITHSFEAYL